MSAPIPHRASVALVLLVCVALVAGCGSSGKPRSAGASQGLELADCMRSHGVPNFPDPTGGGGGIQIPVGSGINPASPSFQQARSACRKLFPGRGAPPRASAQQKAQFLALAECMRAHGVSGFPDPVSSPPANFNPAAFSVAFGAPGAILVVPNTIDTNSPVFKQAAETCHFPGA
jgi:hypothetical protein